MSLVYAVPHLIAGRYQLWEKLGAGGMGAVYRVTDRLTGQDVALKQVLVPTEQLLFNSLSNSRISTVNDPRFALAHEFQILSSLRHPNIISVLDYGFMRSSEDEQTLPYFTMSLLDEPHTIVEAGRGQPLDVKVDLLLQMLQALAYIHRRGILHRDLKPSNVLVRDGRVYVLDFGLATERETHTDETVGTLAYIAPEVLQGAPATEAADLYSVGMIAYEMLSGGHPYEMHDITQLIHDIIFTPVDLSSLGINPQFNGVLWSLLAKDLEDRYKDANEVIDELSRATGQPIPPETAAIRESFLQAAQFVGREDELKTLTDALAGVMQGKGSAWLVGGESGVGKSRLLEELRTRALVRGALVLNGQSVSEGGLAYHLWRDVLRRLALLAQLDASEIEVLRLVVPDVETVLGCAVRDDTALDAASIQKRLLMIVEEMFRRVTVEHPIVLILEDLQWATESLKILTQLNRLVSAVPLLIVGTYRNDERPTLPAELESDLNAPGMQLIPLKRLNEGEIARLSRSMLGGVGELPQVVDLLQKETEGNVFFLVEVVRTLAEEAGRLSDVGKVTLPAQVFAGGVQQIIQRRLGRLPEWAHEAVNVAAVAGRRIDPLLMQALYPALDMEDWLTACTNAAVFDVQDEQWRFAHDKLREGVLSRLAEEEKPGIHRRIAAAIEEVYADQLEVYAFTLNQHWAAAGDTVKEGYYAVIAAEQAHKINEYRSAKRLYERALALKVFEQDDNPRKKQADLHHQLGRVCYNLSEYEEARKWQKGCLAVYRELGDTFGIAEALGSLGELDFRQGKNNQAKPLVEESLRIYRELGHRERTGNALMNLGVIAVQQGELHNAQALFQECYEIMKELGEPLTLGRALNNLANVTDMLGDPERAKELHHEALAIRRRINDRQGIAYSLNNLGWIAQWEGNYHEARDILLESVNLLRAIGERQAVAGTLSLLGEVALALKDYEQSRQYQEESLALRREIGDMNGVATSLRGMGDVAREKNDMPTAWKYYREALKTSVEIESRPGVQYVLGGIAHLLEKEAAPQKALEILVFIRGQHIQQQNPTDDVDREISRLKELLSEEAFAAGQERGESLQLEAILAEFIER